MQVTRREEWREEMRGRWRGAAVGEGWKLVSRMVRGEEVEEVDASERVRRKMEKAPEV